MECVAFGEEKELDGLMIDLPCAVLLYSDILCLDMRKVVC
jgi:hypothetical protein